MSEPPPIYRATNGTYQDAELAAVSNYAELIEARAAIIKAGIAVERALGLPIEKRAILNREELRELTRED